jgi:hypothetical protein
MAALQDPEYYGTMMRLFTDVDLPPKTFVITSETDAKMIGERVAEIIAENGPIIHIAFHRITVDLVGTNENGWTTITAPAITISEEEVEDDQAR